MAIKRILNYIRNMNRVVLGLIALLVIIRIFLPYGVKHGLNWYLANKIESYEGHILDFDLSLWRGAYQIEGLKLWKKGADPQTPLLFVREIDLSLAWRALFRGEILGDLRADQLNVYIVDSASKQKKQLGTEEANWQDVVKKIVPINVESMKITDSQVHFINKDYKIPVDVFLDQLQLSAFNLRNVDNKKQILPSTVRLTGRLLEDATFKIVGQFNALSDPPAFNLDAEMKEFTLQKLNPLLFVYGPFTFARGKFSIYIESAAKEGNITGYAKPFLEDVKMVSNQEHFVSFKHGLYEFLLGFSNLVIRSSVKDAATKVEFSGAMKSPDVNIAGALWTALKNGFGTPVKPGVEKTVNLKDVPPKE